MTDQTKNDEKTEMHPLLPSGAWEGFFCYHYAPTQHKMSIELHFSDNVVTGSGIDEVAPFTWTGTYDLDTFKIKLTKHYATHQVAYRGDIDENGIWGTWEIAVDTSRLPAFLAQALAEEIKKESTGGFHIWPKAQRANSQAEEQQAASKKLEEIFVEVFG